MTAPELSPEELAEVRRFGLDEPEDGLELEFEGMTFPVRFALVGLLVFVLVLVGLVLVTVAKVMLR